MGQGERPPPLRGSATELIWVHVSVETQIWWKLIFLGRSTKTILIQLSKVFTMDIGYCYKYKRNVFK